MNLVTFDAVTPESRKVEFATFWTIGKNMLFPPNTVKLRYNVFLGTVKNSTLYQRLLDLFDQIFRVGREMHADDESDLFCSCPRDVAMVTN